VGAGQGRVQASGRARHGARAYSAPHEEGAVTSLIEPLVIAAIHASLRRQLEGLGKEGA
jgi:hypothetical protein